VIWLIILGVLALLVVAAACLGGIADHAIRKEDENDPIA
jgi:hypothetical protein